MLMNIKLNLDIFIIKSTRTLDCFLKWIQYSFPTSASSRTPAKVKHWNKCELSANGRCSRASVSRNSTTSIPTAALCHSLYKTPKRLSCPREKDHSKFSINFCVIVDLLNYRWIFCVSLIVSCLLQLLKINDFTTADNGFQLFWSEHLS